MGGGSGRFRAEIGAPLHRWQDANEGGGRGVRADSGFRFHEEGGGGRTAFRRLRADEKARPSALNQSAEGLFRGPKTRRGTRTYSHAERSTRGGSGRAASIKNGKWNFQGNGAGASELARGREPRPAGAGARPRGFAVFGAAKNPLDHRFRGGHGQRSYESRITGAVPIRGATPGGNMVGGAHRAAQRGFSGCRFFRARRRYRGKKTSGPIASGTADLCDFTSGIDRRVPVEGENAGGGRGASRGAGDFCPRR